MPNNTRYRQSRILVRPLLQGRGQSREEFKTNALLLRRHFEQFNKDVSEICQWLMGLRPAGRKGFPESAPFWENFLVLDTDSGATKADGFRLQMFDAIAGIPEEGTLDILGIEAGLHASIQAVARRERTTSAASLFQRLSSMAPGHRQLLLKASAEWIAARHLRAYDNWVKHEAQWRKEKDTWESAHPELALEIRARFDAIFQELGIKDKRARICDWTRLSEGLDNCLYAGVEIRKRHHAQRCKQFVEFTEGHAKKEKEFRAKEFPGHLEDFMEILRRTPDIDKAHKEFLDKQPKRGKAIQGEWFKKAWNTYLKEILSLGPRDRPKAMPHCLKFGDNECQHNKHTELCVQYRAALEAQPALQPLEPLYREWRRLYFAPPARPQFRYPSARDLPMPKIFGRGWFDADFETSLLRLRLEHMKQGEWLTFRFAPWPKEYPVQPSETTVTSVHLHFWGVRPRVGFRFETPHKESRFPVSQDELDRLRSQEFPRRAQDQQFLEAARDRLIKSLPEKAKPMRLLAVDLGTSNGFAAVYEDRRCIAAEPLRVAKLDKLYTQWPKRDKVKNQRSNEKPANREEPKREEALGLSGRHVGKHLDAFPGKVQALAKKRAEVEQHEEIATLRRHDLRRPQAHLRGMLRDWVRLNASQIIQAAEAFGVDLIVFESMRGWNAPGYDKLGQEDRKRSLAFFSHGRIRRKVMEKAVERGMRVVTVPYFNSSKVCSNCKAMPEDLKQARKEKTKNSLYHCRACGFKAHSDENAAKVIGRVFWGEILLPVDHPPTT